jgi:hypothetical protein
MYAARFEVLGRPLVATALPVPPGALLPRPWQDVLLGAADAGFGVRLTFRDGRPEALLVLHAPTPARLEELVGLLARAEPSAKPVPAADADAFDRLVAVPRRQLWLNHHGYGVAGQALGTDFRLFPLLDRLVALPRVRAAGFAYQCNLRALPPDRERERAARKARVALELDTAFPAPVVELQQALVARLLGAAVSCDEYLATDDDAALAEASEAIARQFEGTMGPFGFRDSPVEEGDYDELLTTGLPSEALLGSPGLLASAAGALKVDDARRMLGLRVAPPPAPGAVPGARPGVFVSYSSHDFAQASATAQHLEANGIRCWIAPRDIPPGETYPDAIEAGLAAAPVLVVLLSTASDLSPHVMREIEGALRHRATIIPLRVEPIEPTRGLRYLLATCQRLDAFPSFEDALGRLVVHVRPKLRV